VLSLRPAIARLTVGGFDVSKPNDAAVVTLKFETYGSPITKTGEAMITQIKQNYRYPTCKRVQRVQDFFLVSSFALWATLLGFAPVLTYRALLG
jgi:hypothetical protein